MQHLVTRQHAGDAAVRLTALADGGKEFTVLQLDAVHTDRHLGHSRPGRWPESGGVDHGQYPHRFVVDFVHQKVMLVGNQLAGAGHFSCTAQLGVFGQSAG